MATSGANKRKVLTLEERVKVLDHHAKGKKPQAIATMMGCGRTQISKIIQQKESITQLWQSGEGRAEQKIVKKRKLCYDKLDDLVWDWFCIARSKNIPGKFLR